MELHPGRHGSVRETLLQAVVKHAVHAEVQHDIFGGLEFGPGARRDEDISD